MFLNDPAVDGQNKYSCQRANYHPAYQKYQEAGSKVQSKEKGPVGSEETARCITGSNTGQSVGISVIAWLVSIYLANCPSADLPHIRHLALFRLPACYLSRLAPWKASPCRCAANDSRVHTPVVSRLAGFLVKVTQCAHHVRLARCRDSGGGCSARKAERLESN